MILRQQGSRKNLIQRNDMLSLQETQSWLVGLWSDISLHLGSQPQKPAGCRIDLQAVPEQKDRKIQHDLVRHPSGDSGMGNCSLPLPDLCTRRAMQ